MIIGVDFDNTIVCYDGIFQRVAVERGLVPADLPATKAAVRDYLRRAGQDAVFTELQGHVYGPRLVDAAMFPGVKDFFRTCRERGVIVKIISHKTRFPYAGDRHDLHAAARAWLEHHGFFSANDAGLPADAVFLEPTKPAKLARIATERCTHFIDDLPELLTDASFPAGTQRVLFDPGDACADMPGITRVRSWAEAQRVICGGVEEEAPAAAGALFAGAGLRLAAPPVRLAGGGNNRVYAARSSAGDRYLLKQYFSRPGDARDRFESERLFYRLAAVAAPAATPRAFAWDAGSRLALLEMIDGRRLSADEIGGAEVDAALAFFAALNRARESPEARALPVAAEACFSLEKHGATIERRLARLRDIPPEAPIDREAAAFVGGELLPAWNALRASLAADPEAGRELAAAERCVSPSDFGFHNVLRRAGGALVFFDFEYAGWDDPAKTVCDFFCQPALPAPADAFERFARGVAQGLALPDAGRFVARCRRLLPLHRVKWCAILLNEFLPTDRGRRAFALGEAVAGNRKTAQLAAARRMLAAERKVFHGTTA